MLRAGSEAATVLILSLGRQTKRESRGPHRASLSLTFDAKPAGHSPFDPATMLGWTPFSYPFNLTQQPAVVVPCGLTRSGLPIAVQIVGPMHGDALVLRAARAYESTREWKLPVVPRYAP